MKQRCARHGKYKLHLFTTVQTSRSPGLMFITATHSGESSAGTGLKPVHGARRINSVKSNTVHVVVCLNGVSFDVISLLF